MFEKSIQYLLLNLFIPVAMLFANASYAQNVEKSSLWLNVGGFSWHFEDRSDFNQTHPALGLEYWLDDEWAIVAGRYKNSVNRKTNYFGAAYTPWSWHDLRFGLVLGVADGYPKLNKGKWFSMLTPIVTYENGRFGANLIIIPTISESVKGAVAVQFKFRLAEF